MRHTIVGAIRVVLGWSRSVDPKSDGITPRTAVGLVGIAAMPVPHADTRESACQRDVRPRSGETRPRL
jgi:hypothetical protein